MATPTLAAAPFSADPLPVHIDVVRHRDGETWRVVLFLDVPGLGLQLKLPLADACRLGQRLLQYAALQPGQPAEVRSAEEAARAAGQHHAV